MGLFANLGARARAAFARPPSREAIVARPPRDRIARYPQYRSSGLTPAKISSYTRSADQGDVWAYFELLQEIAGRDPLISGLLVTRLSALSQRPAKCKPAVEGDRDAEVAAAYGQSILDGLRLYRPVGKDSYRAEKGLAGVVEALAMAAWYGVRVGWVHWRGLRPVGIEVFDERRLWVDVKDESLTLNSDGGVGRGVPLSDFDPANLLEVRSTRISPRISMSGAGRAVLLDWWLRFGSFKDLAGYLESWAKPSLVGTAATDVAASYGGDQGLATFKNFLEDFLGDTRVLLPPGFEVTVLNAVAGGEAVFEKVDSLTEAHIQYAIVGQTGTAMGGGGSLAKAEVNERVKGDIIAGDAALVGEALTGLVATACAARFGVGCPSPSVEFEVAGDSVGALKEKTLALSQAAYPFVALARAGLPIDIDAYFEPYGIKFRADGKIDPRLAAGMAEAARLLAGQPQGGGATSLPDGNVPPVGAPPPEPGAPSVPGV